MAKEWRQPKLTVDALVLDGDGGLLLIERGRDPYKGRFALPGGYVEYGETVETAATRELEEETGLIGRIVRLFGVYSKPDRDPRGHTVSIIYEIEVTGGDLKAGDDAAKARFFPLERLPELAFDHDGIVSDFLRSKREN